MKKLPIYSIGILAAVAFVAAAFFVGRGLQNFRQGTNAIQVTGLAQKNFDSDLVVLNANLQREAKTAQEAYSKLKQDAETVRLFLQSHGISDKEIALSSVNIIKSYDYVRVTEYQSKAVPNGYQLSQNLKIESKQVDKIEAIMRSMAELIEKGIEINTMPLEYYYTKLPDLKRNMLAEATADGKQRALQIAGQSGQKLGGLLKAQMGVFQIVAQNSSENYSWGGTFNTSSAKKTASVTVSLKYGVR